MSIWGIPCINRDYFCGVIHHDITNGCRSNFNNYYASIINF